MSISGNAIKVSITAWNTGTNAPATGLAYGTFTLTVCADGSDTALTLVASGGGQNFNEDGNGEYVIWLTAAQNTGTMMSLRGSNSTSNVVIVPAKWNNTAPAALLAENAVLYTASLAGIYNDGATDDAATINAAISTLSAAGGGLLVWNGVHAFKSPLRVMSNVHIKAVDRNVRMIYFGGAKGGVDDTCITNKNPAKGLPSRGTINNQTVTAAMPCKLASSITSGATSMTLGAHQGTFLTYGQYPMYVDIDNGYSLRETVKITAGTDPNYTITRAQLGTTAQAHNNGAVVTPTIIDKNITIENLTVNCNMSSYANYLLCNTFYGWYPAGLFISGCTNLVLKNVTLIDSTTYAFHVANIVGGCVCEGLQSYLTTGNQNGIQDAFHIWGPIDHLSLRNSYFSTYANCLALNWGEMDAQNLIGYVPGLEQSSWISGAGDIGDIDIDNVVCDSQALITCLLYGSTNTAAKHIRINGVFLTPMGAGNGLAIIEDYNAVALNSTVLDTLELDNLRLPASANVNGSGPLASLVWGPSSQMRELLVNGGSFPSNIPLVANTGTISNTVRTPNDAGSFTGAFPPAVVANCPTGTQVTYNVSGIAPIGALTPIPLQLQQYMGVNLAIPVTTSMTGHTLTFAVTSALNKTTVLWSISNSNITVSSNGLVVTVTGPNTNTQTAPPQGWYWYLIDETGSARVGEGPLALDPGPNA